MRRKDSNIRVKKVFKIIRKNLKHSTKDRKFNRIICFRLRISIKSNNTIKYCAVKLCVVIKRKWFALSCSTYFYAWNALPLERTRDTTARFASLRFLQLPRDPKNSIRAIRINALFFVNDSYSSTRVGERTGNPIDIGSRVLCQKFALSTN